jgi:hypothetical protein
MQRELLDQLEFKLNQHIRNLPYADGVRIRAAYLAVAVEELAVHTGGRFDFAADLAFAVKP